MCCLGYEIEHYTESAKLLPKVGAEVGTPDGKATVIALNMLKMLVRVKIDDHNGGFIFKEYPSSELQFKKQPQNQNEKTEDEDEEEE
jgi:cell fate regulator YaaT (PSP1 superfamily)